MSILSRSALPLTQSQSILFVIQIQEFDDISPGICQVKAPHLVILVDINRSADDLRPNLLQSFGQASGIFLSQTQMKEARSVVLEWFCNSFLLWGIELKHLEPNPVVRYQECAL